LSLKDNFVPPEYSIGAIGSLKMQPPKLAYSVYFVKDILPNTRPNEQPFDLLDEKLQKENTRNVRH
jgi:hypothetical protein